MTMCSPSVVAVAAPASATVNAAAAATIAMHKNLHSRALNCTAPTPAIQVP